MINNNSKLSSLAVSVALGLGSFYSVANDTPAWDGEVHVGSHESIPNVMFGNAEMSAAWWVEAAPDLGPDYPNVQELWESEPANTFFSWCPGVVAPNSPDYVAGAVGSVPWNKVSGSADGYSCEEEYLRIHGENGGSDVEETNVLIMDPASIETQEINEFDPTGGSMDGSASTTNDSLAMTSARALKPLANTYVRQENGTQKVSAYITDWSQYDARLQSVDTNEDGEVTVNETGRGFDLQKMIDNPTVFDTLIFSFMGICGDTDTSVGSLAEHCSGDLNGGSNSANGEVSLVDHWGDLASQINTGTAGNHDIHSTNWKEHIGSESIGGTLGGMFAIQDAGRDIGHEIELAMSIGGWSMSGYFSEVAANDELRANFVSSVVEYANAWNTGEQKRFHRIDIDWEYPGFGPEGSSCDTCDQDGENYVTLLTELRTALDENPNTAHMKITLATVGVPDKMDEMLPVFEANIADDYFVMTYDYFGTGWAEQLDHHANLYHGSSEFSADSAIQYMKQNGVPAEKIHIGYAGYGRSGAGVENFAAKVYDKDIEALGGFENGAPELADIMFNWLDLGDNTAGTGKPSGKNGFELYTDIDAQAQMLYNNQTGNFISVETPLSVRAKAEYAKEQGLGGIFSWAGDQENGMLANAAHEGAGNTLDGVTWDMNQSYGCGTVVANWGTEHYIELTEQESESVCNGVFNKDYSGYTQVHTAGKTAMADWIENPPEVGDTIVMTVKQRGETQFVAAGIPINADKNEFVYDWVRILADVDGHGGKLIPTSQVNSADNYARFIFGERKGDGSINPNYVAASTYKNGLFCGYDCEDITVEYSTMPSQYDVMLQVKGPTVEPGTTKRLEAKIGDDLIYQTTFTADDYHNLSYRWPDMLCANVQQDFAEEQEAIASGSSVEGDVLACGEISGVNKVETVDGTNYRNYVWSNNPDVVVTITDE